MTTRTKVLIIASVISILVLSIGYQIGDRLGLFIGLVLALGFLGFFFLQGDENIIEFYKARSLAGQDPWQLISLVETIAHAEKFPTPDIFLFEHSHFSLFSYWPLLSKPRLCFSTGALEKLSPDEIKHLVIHQILFLKNTNSTRFQFTQRLCRSLVTMGRTLDYLIPTKAFNNKQVLLFERIFGFLAESIMDFIYSEGLYQELDLLTTQRTQSRELLGELLWRIKGINETLPLPLQPCSRYLFFLDPQVSSKRFKKRVQKLVGYYPV